MSVSKFNAEGYYDPTAYEALLRIERESKTPCRPKVFISSPFAGDTKRNTENARRYCAFAVRSGYTPFAPHLFYPQFLSDDDAEERELGISMGLAFLDVCKECWVFGSVISSGMAAEIERARKRGIPIRYFNGRCEEVSG